MYQRFSMLKHSKELFFLVIRLDRSMYYRFMSNYNLTLRDTKYNVIV